MAEVPAGMFQSDSEHAAARPELHARFAEDDYQGRAYALYRFEGLWFVVQTYFGSCSGCDDWMDSSSAEHVRVRVRRRRRDCVFGWRHSHDISSRS